MKGKEHVHVFTSESVSEGHPDKVADRISDAILDKCLELDSRAHVACETLVGEDLVVNAGEISCEGFDKVDTEAIARRVVADIGYDRPEEKFSSVSLKYFNHLHGQSPDIAMGVNRLVAEEQGAGDQGMMFGYATDETPSYMPAPIVYAHDLLEYFASLRHERKIEWLRPDAKSQISAVYKDGKPVAIDTVVISHQTTHEGATKENYAKIEELARARLEATNLLTAQTKFFINPTGQFVIGGPSGDSGLTGRKIIVDTYGGMASHGGGAFSGKDPSKVDRSAAYYARYAAKNIVAAGAANRCQIQVAYAIGVAKPVGICVKTFGTAKVPSEAIEQMLLEGEIFDFRPFMLIKNLGLLTPSGWKYEDTANYGHFGRDMFPWEKLDKVEAVKARLALD